MKPQFMALMAMLASACAASLKTQGPPSACADDLLHGDYVSGREPQSSAEAYCAVYNRSQIAIAKDLVDKHYEPRFDTALLTAKHYQPAEIACAKRETDAARADTPEAPFTVTEACQGVTFQTPSETAAPLEKPKTLLDALTAEGHCSKFLAAVEKVNLTQSLESGGPWTVFAPTNRAIKNIPGGFDGLMKNPKQLKRFVRAHLVDGVRSSSEIKPTGVKWPTADGHDIVVAKKGAITVNKQAKVIKADIPATNGLIYTIDEVLER
jgi:uncharacterized surface protein with fasciclin (FAS1) repeats